VNAPSIEDRARAPARRDILRKPPSGFSLGGWAVAIQPKRSK
jgi:hypothetical protein